MRKETTDKIHNDYNEMRRLFLFLQSDDYIHVIPTMPNKDKVYDLLESYKLDEARKLIATFRNKDLDSMPIVKLRKLAQALEISTYKTDSPTTLRKKIHERQAI